MKRLQTAGMACAVMLAEPAAATVSIAGPAGATVRDGALRLGETPHPALSVPAPIMGGLPASRLGTTRPEAIGGAWAGFGTLPEPATWGLLVLGLAAVGHALRRRRHAFAARLN